MFSAVDVVVHATVRVNKMVNLSANPLTEFRKFNRDERLTLAALAPDAGVKRFVFLSSIKVKGEETFLWRCPLFLSLMMSLF